MVGEDVILGEALDLSLREHVCGVITLDGPLGGGERPTTEPRIDAAFHTPSPGDGFQACQIGWYRDSSVNPISQSFPSAHEYSSLAFSAVAHHICGVPLQYGDAMPSQCESDASYVQWLPGMAINSRISM
jgi:hypothetical protein